MTESSQFEVVGGIAIVRLIGAHTFLQAVRRVTSAIVSAREERVAKLLSDVTQLIGIDPPSIGARNIMVREWALAAQGTVRGAMVARREFIDPQKFGVVVAANFGLIGNVFETEAEAMAWLRELDSRSPVIRALQSCPSRMTGKGRQRPVATGQLRQGNRKQNHDQGSLALG